MVRVAAALSVATCVVLLAGCSSSSTPDDPAPTGSRTSAAPQPTVVPTPTPTPAVNDESDAAGGITFASPPPLEGDAAQAYNWISVYEKAYWNTLKTNAVDPSMSLYTSAEALAAMQQLADTNANIKAQIAGSFKVTVSDVVVDGHTATATVCEDYTAVTFADATRSYTPAEAGFDPPVRDAITLLDAGDHWIVQTDTKSGTC